MELLLVMGVVIVAVPTALIGIALWRTSSHQKELESLRTDVAWLSRRLGDLYKRLEPDAAAPSEQAEPARADEVDLPDTARRARGVTPDLRLASLRVPTEPSPAAPPADPDVAAVPDTSVAPPPTPEGVAGVKPDAGAEPSDAAAETEPLSAAAEPEPVAVPDSDTEPEPEARPEPDDWLDREETAQPEPVAAAMDLETRIGKVWLLRLGVAVLAVALALFARDVIPQLPAGAKVAIAYAGALLFFGAGKFFEARLERFARPVMAAGLSFGFFVAYAAYFVPAMQAVSLPVSIVWMIASMVTVLVAAERWRSEYTAGLAILLGHISAYVAAGDAGMYSLVLIGLLALTAIVLLLRHEWVALGVFAVVVSYGSHVLWMLAERGPVPADQGFWLNLAFLTSYCTLFLIADVLWWRRNAERSTHDLSRAQQLGARQLGPTNLVLYVTLTSFVFFTTETDPWAIEWYFLSLGAIQGALAWLYRGVHHRDFVFYPAFGTVLWTLGLFAALDALVLNLVLAGQALLLLLAAHRTRLWIFHGLAQAALFVAFVHYVAYPVPATSSWPVFLGGLGLVAVYFLMASLEEVWYGDGAPQDWFGSADAGEEASRIARAFRDFFVPIASSLAPIHAALGGLVLVRETVRHFGPGTSLVLSLSAAALILVGLVLGRRRIALLFGLTAIAAAQLFVRIPEPLDAVILLGALTGSALLVVHFTRARIAGESEERAAWHGQAVVTLVLVGAFTSLVDLDLTFASYLMWMAIPFLIFVFQERARGVFESFDAPPDLGEDVTSHTALSEDVASHAAIGVVVCLAAAALVVSLTAEAVGVVVAAPVWVAAWSSVLLGAAVLRRSPMLFVGGYALLLGGYWYFLFSLGLAADVLSSTWAGAVVTVVPLIVALALDRFATLRRSDSQEDVIPAADLAIYAGYGLGLLLLGGLGHNQLAFGWSLLGPAVVGLVLMWSAPRVRADRAVPSVAAGLMLLHWAFLVLLVVGQAIEDALVPLTLFAVATLIAERAMASVWASEDGESDVHHATRLSLVALAALTTMIAIYRSTLFGAPWTTAGWSVLAVLLMTAGFALKSAAYRRVALVVLAACLLRVFLVDMRGLTGMAQTGAILVLGLCLVGAGWLYTRYSEELKKWL